MTGVALPLIVREFQIGATQKGIVSAASLFGILLGAVLLGGLSDYFGRKRMFIAEMIIFCAFLALLILCTGFLSLAICLFGLGMALGCDYPTAHMIISESTAKSASPEPQTRDRFPVQPRVAATARIQTSTALAPASGLPSARSPR